MCARQNLSQNVPLKHIGSDESGKGDFFGPLVIAGVLVDESNIEVLQKAGIKDCKKVDDKNINKLAAIIKNNCTFSVITINPAKYNELYAKLKNLNLLLAWGHARAIENIDVYKRQSLSLAYPGILSINFPIPKGSLASLGVVLDLKKSPYSLFKKSLPALTA